MKKLLTWSKNNWQLIVIVALVFYAFTNSVGMPIPLMNNSYNSTLEYGSGMEFAPTAKMQSLPRTTSFYADESTDMYVDVAERRTIDNNYISLKVENVNKALGDIKQKTLELKGFVVSFNVSRPEESTTADVVIRIPKTTAEDLQAYIRGLGVKVVSESMDSSDITDQYRDLETELQIYQENKGRFEQILNRATTVEEILQVQNEIINIQRQIDSIKGQKQYLESVSESVRFTVYLATDEYALPYVPDKSWNPKAIFKEAVRSMILSIRGLGNIIIWAAVYSVIWAPIALAIFFWRKRKN